MNMDFLLPFLPPPPEWNQKVNVTNALELQQKGATKDLSYF